MNVILAESELELVPDELLKHPMVKKYADSRGKPPGKCLLDANYCYEAVLGLDDGSTRGKPEILHMCLLTALESILNKDNKLKLWIHTRNNEIINIDPKARVPRAYVRFVELMEQLFAEKRVPPENPLMVLKKGSLKSLVDDINPPKAVLFSQNGKLTHMKSVADDLKKSKNPLVVIGGFSDRDYSPETLRLFKSKVSLSEQQLAPWSVLAAVLYMF